MTIIKRLAVFCGASLGTEAIYAETARNLATVLAQNNIELVYGGGRVGLMGEIANAMLQQQGKVIGVIPQFLMDKELGHSATDLHIVNSMHERKALMEELADGFILLPGGAGSLDEFFEIFTWAQLGLHGKPCGILNVDHYYDDLLKFLDQAVAKNFINIIHRKMIIVENSPQLLLEAFANYQAPEQKRWMELTEQV